MNRQSPHARAQELRRTFVQLIFAWGSVLSAAWYALLTLLGRPPLIDDHITVTAITMLGSYLLARIFIDLWRQRSELRGQSWQESTVEDRE